MKTKLQDLTDEQLLRLAEKGDRKAFEALFNKYWKRLYAYAYKIYNEEEICEDIVQEVFISFWKNIESSKILNLESYLLNAVKYKVAKHIRDLKFNRAQLDIIENIPAIPASATSLEYKEYEHQIFEVIEHLPTKCRKVFLLSRFKYLTNDEIAKKQGISKRTVEAHISYALKYLRSKLEIIQILILVILTLLEY